MPNKTNISTINFGVWKDFIVGEPSGYKNDDKFCVRGLEDSEGMEYLIGEGIWKK